MCEKLLVSVEEAAELLSVSRRHMYSLLSAGELESVKVGRSRRVRMSVLREWVENLPASAFEDPDG